jgi:UDP-N-acetylglucosamine--N-acetylmuramyl-(pentapeptide) pyrophosphoryl-undecaprenol N-acetylglucosamine transferase
MKKKPKIMITTGGTGGHIFPATALAIELASITDSVLFVGGGLETNRYFDRNKFLYEQIVVGNPSKENFFKASYRIVKGVLQSFKIFGRFKPSFVVGFGSFYTFPVLVAAWIRRVPIIIFEANAVPGKVNRFFSRFALFSVGVFVEKRSLLRGDVIEVAIPMGERKKATREVSANYFCLDPQKLTFLVFGGSQGAEVINRFFTMAIEKISLPVEFQVIHIAGNEDGAETLSRFYKKNGIASCVKGFESRMDLAWSLADIAICRSGSATVAEQIAFEVPTIFIPYPKALEDHQMQNARFVEKHVGGGITCVESDLSVESFKNLITELIEQDIIKKMKEAIVMFNKKNQKKNFALCIKETWEKLL